MRICDLTLDDMLCITCKRCGRTTVYSHGWRVKWGWATSTKAIASLRFRCKRCHAISGFRIQVESERAATDKSVKIPPKIILE